MNVLEQLATTQDPVLRKMIEARRDLALESNVMNPCVASFDNQPTWDNWSKQPDPFKKEDHLFPKEVAKYAESSSGGWLWMDVVKYGCSKIVLPYIEDGLGSVEDLGRDEPLSGYLYADRKVRHISVLGGRLSSGRICKIEAERATFTGVRFNSGQFENCLFISSEWDQCSLSRVVFRDCKILGATFRENKWSNVIFDRCKIEYGTFESVRASAPIAFVDTQFKQVTFTGCDFPKGHMSGCELESVEFIGGGYHEFDLRDNDLSRIRGAANLHGVFISPAQRQELGEALVSELDLRYPEDCGQ
ncbi:MAG: pentapeptide repeat-containing protein [Gammaproteobacteria bacterium]